MGGRPLDQDVSPRERVAPLGQPCWSGESRAERLGVGRRRFACAGAVVSAASSWRPSPCSAARARTASRQLGVSIAVRFGSRVASAAFSAERRPLLPSRSSHSSISARRRLNSRRTSSGTPSMSAIPFSTAEKRDPRQPLAHRVSEVCLVEVAGRLRVPVERVAVERRPAVLRAGEVGGDDVGVKLRVLGAAHPVAVGGRDEALGAVALGLLPHPVAAAHEAGLALEVGARGAHGLVVGVAQRARGSLVGDRVEDADRLRRREGEVVGEDARAVAGAAELLPAPRMLALDQDLAELVGAHLALEPEGLGALALPLPPASPLPE